MGTLFPHSVDCAVCSITSNEKVWIQQKVSKLLTLNKNLDLKNNF